MKSLSVLFLFFCISTSIAFAQEKNEVLPKGSGLPYFQIPDYPEAYTPENVAARVIDGLGFRYYWVTEGLRSENLTYKPNEEARTTLETIDHIYGLSEVIVNAMKNEPNIPAGDVAEENYSFEELRQKTLSNLKAASDILKASKEGSIGNFSMVFQRGENSSEYPFWNLLNGPIADAIWHTGQVVSFRRSSGNPFNSKVSLFQGKLRE